MATKEMLNCIDIIRPYVDAVSREGMPPVQFLGGVGSAAFLDKNTYINTDEKRIIAPSDLQLSNYRDDGNLRDVEALVLSSNEAHSEQVEACGVETVKDQLIVEVFGFRDIAKASELTANPFGVRALKTVLSDRYMPVDTVWNPAGPEPQRMLFPFSAPITPESLETWTLEIGDKLEVPVPSPGATIINYLTRSISGLRDKDETKVQEMGNALFGKSPELVDWIIDGPGGSQFEMARVLHTLRESGKDPKTLTIGGKLFVEPMARKSLVDHPTFMLVDADHTTQKRALQLATIKSLLLHTGESMSFVVTLFQRYVEPRIHSITHNK